MLDRTDRSLVGVWWWTIDRWLLASALLLMVVGTLLVMAAGPAVATLINLPSQHFGVRQGIFLVPAVGLMLAVSLLHAVRDAVSVLHAIHEPRRCLLES